MKANKLNVLLAKTDHLAGVFKKGLEEYAKFFKNSQGSFKGIKKTYVAKQGTVDQPSLRQSVLVVTTVDEKLNYFFEGTKEYVDALFSLEKTNASGLAKAELKVGEKSFGEYTSMELLRLKSLLESSNLKEMYENLPVRKDDQVWNKSQGDSAGRAIFESNELSGVAKSMVKESYILPDPNIASATGAKYTPQIGTKDTILELGDYTIQEFSGEYTHTQRAAILERRSKLLTAVISALKVANDVESIPSDMTAEKILNYLHKGE